VLALNCASASAVRNPTLSVQSGLQVCSVCIVIYLFERTMQAERQADRL
jgi:hypothetical protein